MNKSVVFIMAHADDIEFYAGGTFASYIDRGYRALYGVLSRCNSGYTNTADKGEHYISSLEIIPQRRKEAEAAAEFFGAELYYGDLLENCYTLKDGTRITYNFKGPKGLRKDVAFSDIDDDELIGGDPFTFAAGVMEDTSPYVEKLAEILIEWEPELVVGQGIGNPNLDHFSASMLMSEAWKQAAEKADIGPFWIPAQPRKKQGFPPIFADRYVDITEYKDKAIAALACHRCQGGHLESTASARLRTWELFGEEMGVKYAEGFCEVYRK